jgi:hypothetical protein
MTTSRGEALTAIRAEAVAKMAAAKTSAECETILAEYTKATDALAVKLESDLQAERQVQYGFLKRSAIRSALEINVKPKMLDAACALFADTFDLQVTADRKVTVKTPFGSQNVASASARWLATAEGRAFAAWGASAAFGPFESALRKVLH